MSSDEIVLKVRNISKCFEMYDKPVHRLYQTLCAGRKKFYREFWALRGIDFEVRRGECVGIIGKNGAGKSTLLQIITGTLQPTTGTVETKGRVAALLELGSGFNPEFTGRENVYLNASILGLSTAEIDAKYQEIVDFADIGEFIDQPVKTYSSGMMVRLAFAVQVMIEPDILIVDEALAVGDACFQRKCYAYLDKLKRQGTSLLLVTHDTETIKQRCERVLFLKDRCGHWYSDARAGVMDYMRYLFPHEDDENGAKADSAPEGDEASAASQKNTFVYEHRSLETDQDRWGSGGGTIHSVRVHGLKEPNVMVTPGTFKIELDAEWNPDFVRKKIMEEHFADNIMIGIRFSDVKHFVLFETNNVIEKFRIDPFERNRVKVTYTCDFPMLRTEPVFLTVALSVGDMAAHLHLLWDDLMIQLQAESPMLVTGAVRFPTQVQIDYP